MIGQSFGDPGSSGGDGGGSSSRTATVVLNADVSGYQQAMNAAAAQTNALSGSVGSLQQRLHGMDKWAGRKLLRFSAGDTAVLGGMTADAATFEKQLSTLSATAAVTGGSFKGIKSSIESTFMSFPASRGEVIQLTESLSNLGVTGERDLKSLTATFLKLGAATGENSSGLAQGTVQLSRLMGVKDSGQIGNMANVLLTLSKNAGTSASGILSFSQAIAPLARQAGIGEASVMGISTAFSKAGADGYVAANTFNSIVGQISQSMASGSQDVAKYSNLLGVSVGQFNKMDKTEAVTQIFEKIGKMGPSAVNVLNQMGIDGVRAQSAIAAVTQSGDLRTQIQTALGAQTNQHNLTKGSEAAFNNLADSLAHLRNNFTELGTVIGTTFLKPLTMATNAIGGVVHAAAGMSHVLSGVVGAGAGAAAGAGLAGGVALNAAGLIGTVALGRYMLKGAPVTNVSDAIKAQRGLPLDKRAQESLARYTDPRGPQMGQLQRAGYVGGSFIGRVLGPANPDPAQMGSLMKASTWRNLGISAPFRVGQFFMRTQADMLREARHESWDRVRFRDANPRRGIRETMRAFVNDNAGLKASDVIGQEAVRTAHIGGDLTGAYVGTGAQQLGRTASWVARYGGPRIATSLIAGMTGVPFAGVLANRARQAATNTTGGMNLSQSTANFNKAAYALGAAARHPISAFNALAPATRDAGAALAKLGLVGVGSAISGTVSGVTTLVGKTAQLGWSLTKMAGRAALSWPGMIGLAAGTTIYQKQQSNNQASNINNFLNPIQKYNDELGTVTSNLANFNTAINEVVKSASGLISSWDQVKTVSQSTVDSAPSKPTDDIWSKLGAADPKDKKSIREHAALLGTMQISDPKQLYYAEGDMAASGMKLPAIQKVIDYYYKTMGGPNAGGLAKHQDFDALAQATMATEGKKSGIGAFFGGNFAGRSFNPFGAGWSSANPSKTGNQFIGTAMTGIDAQRQTNETNANPKYAKVVAATQYAELFGPLLRESSRNTFKGASTRQAVAEALGTLTSGGTNGYLATISKASGVELGNAHGVKLDSHMTNKQTYAEFFKVLGTTKQGKEYIANLPKELQNPDKWAAAITKAAGQSAGSFRDLLRKEGGALGKTAADNSVVRAATTGNKVGNAGYTQASVEFLANTAIATGHGLAGASDALLKFTSKVKDSTSQLYQQAVAAQQYIEEMQSYKAPFQSRGQNFADAVHQYQGAVKGQYSTALSAQNPEMIQHTADKRKAFQAALADQQSYMLQMYQTAQQYGTQQVRAEEDYGTQVYRSKLEFHTQMLRSEFDYERQVDRARQDFRTQQGRSEQDYRTSQSRAEHDYQRQTARSTQDFERQTQRSYADYYRGLRNQAETAAQSIYNPYTRVQSQYVTDGATLVQNLVDQNQRIAQQRQQLNQLKKKGLSEQAVQDLNLADPNNAQQLNSLMLSISQDPSLIKQMNRQVSTRVQGTKDLTQNKDNLQFSQAEKEFATSMARSRSDFQLQMNRSGSDFHLQQDRARADFQRTSARSAQDYERSMARATQDYHTATARAEQDQTRSLSEMAQDYHRTVRRAGEDLTTAMKEVTGSFGAMYDKTMAQIANSVTKFSPKAAKQMKADLKSIVQEFPFLMSADASQFGGYTPTTPRGGEVLGRNGKVVHGVAGGRPQRMAVGGITTGSTVVETSEFGQPEAIIPLNHMGLGFMADFTREVLRELLTSGHPMRPMGGGEGGPVSMSDDHSTHFTGPITVEAQDTKQMLKELQDKARLRKLSSPAHGR